MIEPDELAVGPALRQAELGDAPQILRIITAAFQARPALDPPADALSDTLSDIEQRLESQIGVIAADEHGDVGCLFLSLDHGVAPPTGMLHRVSVLPGQRRYGIASAMVRATARLAAEAGMRRLQLIARRELPGVVTWWASHGLTLDHEVDEHRLMLTVDLPARIEAATAGQMQELGRRLAARLRPGDLIVANGELGAGKTTLTQGIGEGLAVAGPITSPTFVLSRIHPSAGERPQLVHVDAYRLGSAAELDDLDLDATVGDSVTVVEWGAGLAEGLAADRLEIDIERSDDPDDETRTVTLQGVGRRWRGVDLWSLAEEEL